MIGTFYYSWWARPDVDDGWAHWTENGRKPPTDIDSDYYPIAGPYSSCDPDVLHRHMEWASYAGIQLLVVSWWGNDTGISELLDVAAQYGIKVSFHVEPYVGRDAETLPEDVEGLNARYGHHPAFFRTVESKGVFFVYATQYRHIENQQHVPPDYWADAVDQIHQGPNLVLAEGRKAYQLVTEGHFDGAYVYADTRTEPDFSWARALPQDSLYAPCIIPGYSRERAGQGVTTPRSEETYTQQYQAVIAEGVQPSVLLITSFNEWHEGTQIEPAAEEVYDGLGGEYESYTPLAPDGYLMLTRLFADKYQRNEWSNPEFTRTLRVRITTTSDWTALSLVGGGEWCIGDVVSGNVELFSLPNQQIRLAGETFAEVDMLVAVDGPLRMEVGRGYIGSTHVEVLDGQTVLADITWDGINSAVPENTLAFEVVL